MFDSGDRLPLDSAVILEGLLQQRDFLGPPAPGSNPPPDRTEVISYLQAPYPAQFEIAPKMDAAQIQEHQPFYFV